jgi:hypothetical protein
MSLGRYLEPIRSLLARLRSVDGIGSGLDADLLQGTDLSALVLKATLTTKGDVYVATGSGTLTRLGVGANGTVLTADSAQTSGIKWAAPGGGGGGGDMSQSTYDPNADGVIGLANGGTGATTAAAARTAIGVSTVGNTGDAADLTGTLAAARVASNSLALAKLVNATGTAKIIGRYSASSGAWQELTISTGLAVDASGNLTATATAALPAIVTKTANYTATGTDYTILCNAVGGAFTITLPAAASSTGLLLNIKKIDTSTNTVTVDANSTELIDASLTKVLNSSYQNITVHCNGTGWYVL